MGFTETWIPEITLHRLRELVVSTEGVVGGVIEIGVWEGRSFVGIAEAAAPRTAHAVDHFAGSISDNDPTLQIAVERDVHGIFLENIAHLENVEVHRVHSDEFMSQWTDSIAFLHLDADHGYESVRKQIEWALPLLSPGAVLCGDDYSDRWPGVVHAVAECLPSATVEQYMWIYRQGQE